MRFCLGSVFVIWYIQMQQNAVTGCPSWRQHALVMRPIFSPKNSLCDCQPSLRISLPVHEKNYTLSDIKLVLQGSPEERWGKTVHLLEIWMIFIEKNTLRNLLPIKTDSKRTTTKTKSITKLFYPAKYALEM